jgi:hypothetical protein
MAMNLAEWHYRVGPARSGGGYVAWAAMTPELGEAPRGVALGQVVLFLFDDSEEEALDRLKLAIMGEAHEVELRAARRATLGNTMNSEDYRHLAEEEAALAKTAVSNCKQGSALRDGCLLQPLGGRERKVSDRGGSHDQKRKHRHVDDGQPKAPTWPADDAHQ